MKKDIRAASQSAKPAASPGKGALPPIKLSERDRQAGFALLAILALGLVAYVVFLAPPADAPSDMDTFVGRVLGSKNVALLMDARGASQESKQIVFQCGVDIAGGSLFGSKVVTSYACDDKDGCISANSASNGSSALTYDTVLTKLRESPYIVVRAGAPSTAFFANHAEITVDESFNASCKLG
ncbi:MAG: hypothetical protein WC263_01000 [Candidatus Micrarchaeia archaeon]|jgi:hypothetical protein